MTDEIQDLIQADLDGRLTESEKATLQAAEAVDPDIRRTRDFYLRITGALSDYPAPVPPADLTRRVMAALPPPRPRTSVSGVTTRVAGFFESLFPRERRKIAFAFATGIVLTVGLNAMLGGMAPGDKIPSGSVGTLIGPDSGQTTSDRVLHSVALDQYGGTLDIVDRGEYAEYRFIFAENVDVRLTLRAADGELPEILVAASDEAADTRILVFSEAQDVRIDATSASLVRFRIAKELALQIGLQFNQANETTWIDVAIPE